MVGSPNVSGKSFSELERTGWERVASTYDGMAGAVTGGVVEPLLEVTSVSPGDSVLEVCCGPGYGAAAASERGAEAVGLDFSGEMVSCARRFFPGARFDEGDAQALPYGDASFDAVICAFGLLHLPDPDQAIAEAYRVLKPGGAYAYAVWCSPERMAYFRIIIEAVKKHGTMDVPLPEAPPIFRFSEPAEGSRALTSAGFEAPQFQEIPLEFRPENPEDVLEFVYKSTVRMPMVLQLQSDEAREQIHKDIIENAKKFEKHGRIELPMPAVLGSARKPATK